MATENEAAPETVEKEIPAGTEPAAEDKGGEGGEGEGGSFLSEADKAADKKVEQASPADFPEDWRDKLAGDDKKLRKALDRYASPGAWTKAGWEAQQKLTSGKGALATPPPDGEADPEALKAWRKDNGVPEDATGYAIPDTVKALVTDADKPMLSSFTEAMLAKNIPNSAAGAAIEWYMQVQEANQIEQANFDKTAAREVEDELRKEWGTDFRANATLAKRVVDTITPGLDWFNARSADGRRLGDIPEFVMAMADMGRREYGDAAFVNGDSTQKFSDRKAEIERLMTQDPSAYRADPKLAKEYEDIIDKELKRSGSRSAHDPKP